ncbi:MAG: N-acetylmuramoyl-L-alanine amidase family protein [Lachnospiraceae bacterium]|nr:N-acetylmuramoyl-L-alanine amidase family protein [Lachnospiraceae bacterium]
MKQLKKRILALGLSVLMTLSLIPMLGGVALADEEAATTTVYLTVSNQGELAKAADGSVMAWKPVTVTDLDGDAKFTFDEALVAAHKAYNTEAGYARYDSGWVTSVWGESETGVFSFFKNDQMTDLVTTTFVQEDDYLVAAVDVDAVNYADLYSFFDSRDMIIDAGAEISLSLKTVPAMTPGDPKSLSGASVGYFTTEGEYVDCSVQTDEEGSVKLTFDEPGTYYVSAKGTGESIVTPYEIMQFDPDSDLFVKITDWTTYDMVVPYTDEDYGNGPYPLEELKYLDFYEEWMEMDEAEQAKYHTLKSNMILISEAPIIAPCCTVVVCPTEFTYYGDDLAVINADGKAFGMWTPQEGSTVSLEGDNVVLHIIPKNKTVYGGFIWGSIDLIPDDLTSEDADLDFAANADGSLDITLSKDYCGKATPIAPIKKKGGTTSEQYYLAIPSANKLIVDEMDDIQQVIDELQKQLDELKEQLTVKPGWNKDGDNWVFYDESYHQVKGWLKDGGKWYFMDKTTGFMHTGWVEDEGTWYYMNGSGAMQTGWQKIGNTWYFLKSSGAMAANEWCGGYWLNANGSWTYQPKGSWKQNSTGWWFGDTSGWYAKNTTQKIDGVDYTFNAAGYWVK